MEHVQSTIDELKGTMPEETYRLLCNAPKRARELDEANEVLVFEIKYNKLTITIDDGKLYTSDSTISTVLSTVLSMEAFEGERIQDTSGDWRGAEARGIEAIESGKVNSSLAGASLHKGEVLKKECDREVTIYYILSSGIAYYRKSRRAE